jgi:beta-glucosidase
VRRILKDKFKLGLFDSPYVAEAEAGKISGKETFRKKGKEAQGKSTVLLKNDNMLPLKKGTKIYAQGMLDPTVLSSYGEVVSNMENADVIVLRIQTPFDPRDEYMLESFFHQGRLFYSEEENNAMFELIRQKPTIVVVNLERPAILTDINAASKALIADFGTSDEVLADVLFGTINPSAKLPFELPSTWEAVQKQLEDVPYDSENPLFRFGFGLSYE